MLYRFVSFFLACGSLFIAPTAWGEEAPAWEIGTPPPPPPPPQASAGPTTYVVENSYLGEPKTRMASPVMFGIGAALGGLGIIALGTGYGVYKDAPECNDCPGSEKQGIGTGFMVGGALSVLIGLPLAIIGARQVPDTPSWARAMPQVFISPRGGALRWTF